MEKVINCILKTKFIVTALVVSAIVTFVMQAIAYFLKLAPQLINFSGPFDAPIFLLSLFSIVYQPLVYLSLAKIISLMDHKNA